MEVIGFILIGGMVLVFFAVTKIGAKTNMSDEERKKVLEAFYSQSSVEAKPSESWDLLREGFSKEEGASICDELDDFVYDTTTNPAYSCLVGNIYHRSND